MIEHANSTGSVGPVVAPPVALWAPSVATTGGSPASAARPDPDVLPQAKRRAFTAAYKRAILERADHCTEPGRIGGCAGRALYSPPLTNTGFE